MLPAWKQMAKQREQFKGVSETSSLTHAFFTLDRVFP
jgi:hypothetical protein